MVATVFVLFSSPNREGREEPGGVAGVTSEAGVLQALHALCGSDEFIATP
jgi:hypothetical protein